MAREADKRRKRHPGHYARAGAGQRGREGIVAEDQRSLRGEAGDSRLGEGQWTCMEGVVGGRRGAGRAGQGGAAGEGRRVAQTGVLGSE